MCGDAQRVRSLFLAAVQLPVADRVSFLERECGADSDIRCQVESLLRAHDDPDQVESHVADQIAATVDKPERLDRQIGPYKVRERLGEGGMGVVWAAEQKQPLQRKVALKVIKPGMDSRSVVARFEAEREALALMDHPNIARVLDAGMTDEGLPYFVMELIRGSTITEYCDVDRLPISARLALFVDVCKAVQHAHQKGIIHRDIKPSNVMVTVQDDRPVCKVIDFGVAKALHHPLTDGSVYTGVFQAVGTLPYMSPEQTLIGGVDIDTRADIFGLGVLLYELLTGVTPLDKEDLASASPDEACRIIREREPPKPSTRVSALGARTTEIARNRQTHEAGLRKAVRGDLDWIVMKALEKDRKRRYETAIAFAEDVQRHLAHQPVQARRPSLPYRTRKYCRRHRLGLSAAAALLLLMGTAIAVGLHAMRARIQAAELRAQMAERDKQLNDERWTRTVAIPEIERLLNREDYVSAYEMVQRARTYITDEPVLESLLSQASTLVSLETTPPGATVSIKPWNRPDAPWQTLGITPLRNERIPRGVQRWLVTLPGHAQLEAAIDIANYLRLIAAEDPDFARNPVYTMTLVAEDAVPDGMVPIQGTTANFNLGRFVDVGDFFLDRYEVTNADYLEFVKSDGYSNQAYWNTPIIRDGRTIAWREAMGLFRDQTGHPGPATWRGGTYAEGQGEFPVSGISWYEAAAYATYRGKSLPTIHHWTAAADVSVAPHLTALSNFSGHGPAAVGRYKGIGRFCVYDLAGNLKEWCHNSTHDHKRWLKGGA